MHTTIQALVIAVGGMRELVGHPDELVAYILDVAAPALDRALAVLDEDETDADIEFISKSWQAIAAMVLCLLAGGYGKVSVEESLRLLLRGRGTTDGI